MNTSNYMNSKIFLVNENDDGYGYLCSQYDETIYAQFWAPNEKLKRVSYHSAKYMYESAKQFQLSMLRTFSPSHIAMGHMFQAFIKWYEMTYTT